MPAIDVNNDHDLDSDKQQPHLIRRVVGQSAFVENQAVKYCCGV